MSTNAKRKEVPDAKDQSAEKRPKLSNDKKAKLLQALSKSKQPIKQKPQATANAKPAPVQPATANKLPSTLSKPKIPQQKPPRAKVTSSTSVSGSLTDLQAKMKKTLSGGRFRMINEQLYTTTSDVAVELFKEEPETFDIYHEGFRAQVELWPSNPVNYYCESLSAYKRPKSAKFEPLVIADMGCGEAALAKTLMALNTPTNEKFQVHSFDLASPNEYVVACDIRKVPLEDAIVDVCVFSLSLMGTNFIEFLEEAWRILKDGGELRIAEVISRFPDVNKFVDALTAIGFKFSKKDSSNKMFILFEFLKVEKPAKAVVKKTKGKQANTAVTEDPLLTPCLYRKR
ncbi:UNVERIFIED_CONTAM: 25S rRNA (adenine645-N1)-methyltransferase [Siphonaria sp. JEL0065]|nr:25S rRNA (adenine645-N1)-methyltransferase [Siphonaria sp. JEL0065]